VEDLGSAPSIMLDCGHVFHYNCVTKKLQQRWPAARITFGFCECPLCKKWISHPALKELTDSIEKLYNEIKVFKERKISYLQKKIYYGK
jgi:E3 ubiquitin-protein ligase MYCBP2